MSTSLPDPIHYPLQNQADVRASWRNAGIVSFLLVSLVLNSYLLVSVHASAQTSTTRQAAEFPLISKRVFVDNPNNILVNFVALRTQLRNYVESRPHRLGLYFEYLPSGVSIGLNEKDNFIQASLLKVPIVMAVFSDVEKGKLTLDQKVTIQERHLDKGFGTLWQAGAGKEITIQEAVNLTLTQSDNTAKNVLLSVIDLEDLDQVYDYLDIPKESEDLGPVVSAKNYSSILRSLYLASFLPTDHSNYILEQMTHSVHKDKLVAGVASKVPVAHKIGVYTNPTIADPDIYTDCGIVYARLRPYILCLMVEAPDEVATTDMKNLSEIVYTYVTQANK